MTLIITEPGTPLCIPTQIPGETHMTWVSVEDWTDEHGERRHSRVEVGSDIYVMPEGAAAMGVTA